MNAEEALEYMYALDDDNVSIGGLGSTSSFDLGNEIDDGSGDSLASSGEDDEGKICCRAASQEIIYTLLFSLRTGKNSVIRSSQGL